VTQEHERLAVVLDLRVFMDGRDKPGHDVNSDLG